MLGSIDILVVSSDSIASFLFPLFLNVNSNSMKFTFVLWSINQAVRIFFALVQYLSLPLCPFLVSTMSWLTLFWMRKKSREEHVCLLVQSIDELRCFLLLWCSLSLSVHKPLEKRRRRRRRKKPGHIGRNCTSERETNLPQRDNVNTSIVLSIWRVQAK